MLVEKIAVCWWRQKRALRCEAGTIWAGIPTFKALAARVPTEGIKSEEEFHRRAAAYISRLSLPLNDHERLDRILRYETTINRQLAYAVNQLERLQRARKGEHVPAPVTVQFSGDE
jgi:hypothetical protein